MKYARPVVGLVISGLLLWLLFRSTDLTDVALSLREANYLMLVPAILVYFGGVWLRAVRWGILLRPIARLSLGRLFKAVVIGFAVNDLLPLRLGEIARAILLARWAQVPPGASLGTIVVERLFDGLTLCAILALCWIWFPLDGWLGRVALLAGMVFLLGVGVALLATTAPRRMVDLAGLVIRPLPQTLRGRMLHLLASFLDGLAVLRERSALPAVVGLSLLAWLCEATMYYLIMLGFEIDAGPVAALLGMVAANLGTMVPSSPGFVGTFDVPLQTVLIDVFGVDPSLATSYTLVVHAALIVPVVALGLVLLWREGLSLAEVSRQARLSRTALSRTTDAAPGTL